MMKKIDRQKVFDKFKGKCSYCGCELEKSWHVDHLVPIYRGWSDLVLERHGKIRGSEEIDNLFPSCGRCNKWKSTFSLEEFRQEIQLQTLRLHNKSSNYRLAKDFGLIQEVLRPVKFYFECL